MSSIRTLCLVLLSSFATALMPVSALAYYGYGHTVPTYGYTYGPVFNYGYFAGPIFGEVSNDNVYRYRDLGCPTLCLGGYWRDKTRRRPIAIARGNRILIR
jgi:hypothetical protein